MSRFRSIVGLLAGAMMILSSAAHSALGWKQLSAALAESQAPADLIGSLRLGWHLAGVAMLAFGIILVATFAGRLRGAAAPMMPAIVIGATYLLFGAWALLASAFDPFFFVFVVPGILTLVASVGSRGR